MNVKLVGSLIAISIIACPLLYIFVGPALDASQLETLKVLGIIAGSSAFAEEISAGKYPQYANYCQQVPKFFSGKKYVNPCEQ